MSEIEKQRIETKLNFVDIEADCRRRGIAVHEYFHEYADHLYELYIRWSKDSLPKGTTAYEAKTMKPIPPGK